MKDVCNWGNWATGQLLTTRSGVINFAGGEQRGKAGGIPAQVLFISWIYVLSPRRVSLLNLRDSNMFAMHEAVCVRQDVEIMNGGAVELADGGVG